MADWKAKISEGVRSFFVVVDANGNLLTGIDSGDFTVTIMTPDDSASQTLAVTESSQVGGVYYVDIPSAFLTTHGVGHYGLVISINVTGPPALVDTAIRPIEVTVTDIDTVNNTVRGTWEIVGTQMIMYDVDEITPLQTFNLFDKDGNPTSDPTQVFRRVRA